MIRMRDKNQSFIQFQKQVKEYVLGHFQISKFLTTTVVISPTFLEDYNIIYPRKFREVLKLVILHWYLPEALLWRINLDLHEKNFNNFNRKQRIILFLCLSSKRNCLLFLYKTRMFSSNSLWGLLGEVARLENLRIVPRTKYVCKPKRKRGYDDKGSRRPLDKWIESFDYTFTDLQLKKDYENYLTLKVINRLKDYFENLNDSEV